MCFNTHPYLKVTHVFAKTLFRRRTDLLVILALFTPKEQKAGKNSISLVLNFDFF